MERIGMEWNAMQCNGIDWSGAHFYFEIYFRKKSSPNHSNGKTDRFNVAMCIRYIHVCKCVICSFHIVKYCETA